MASEVYKKKRTAKKTRMSFSDELGVTGVYKKTVRTAKIQECHSFSDELGVTRVYKKIVRQKKTRMPFSEELRVTRTESPPGHIHADSATEMNIFFCQGAAEFLIT